MQDALVIALKRWDRISAHPNPQSLVLKICIDAAYDITRRRARRGRVVEAQRDRDRGWDIAIVV